MCVCFWMPTVLLRLFFLVEGDGADGGLESRLVGVVVLVEAGVEGGVYDGVLFLVVNALDAESLEEEGLGFFEDFLPLLALVDVGGDGGFLLRFRTANGGEGRVGEEILLEAFGEWSLEVSYIESDTVNLGVVEPLYLQRVLEHETAAGDLADNFGGLGVGGEGRDDEGRDDEGETE